MTRVWAYTRVARTTSAEREAEQRATLAAYIARRDGWKLTAHIADYGPATITRPWLRHVTTAARAGAFDVLLIERLDRITRSLPQLLTLLDHLHHAGITLHVITDPRGAPPPRSPPAAPPADGQSAAPYRPRRSHAPTRTHGRLGQPRRTPAVVAAARLTAATDPARQR